MVLYLSGVSNHKNFSLTSKQIEYEVKYVYKKSFWLTVFVAFIELALIAYIAFSNFTLNVSLNKSESKIVRQHKEIIVLNNRLVDYDQILRESIKMNQKLREENNQLKNN